MTTLNIDIPQEKITYFCRERHIRKLSLFGSALRNDFSAESDVDVLVEFEPGHTPGLAFFAMQRDLSEIIGRQVDLNTANDLEPSFRQVVLDEAQVVYGPQRSSDTCPAHARAGAGMTTICVNSTETRCHHTFWS